MENTKQKLINFIEENFNDDDLLNLYKEVNSYDGSFDFCETWDIEELADCCFFDKPYELARAIIYGDVQNVIDPVRFNGYANLESVSEWELHSECKEYIDDLADWLIDNHDNIYNELIENFSRN